MKIYTVNSCNIWLKKELLYFWRSCLPHFVAIKKQKHNKGHIHWQSVSRLLALLRTITAHHPFNMSLCVLKGLQWFHWLLHYLAGAHPPPLPILTFHKVDPGPDSLLIPTHWYQTRCTWHCPGLWWPTGERLNVSTQNGTLHTLDCFFLFSFYGLRKLIPVFCVASCWVHRGIWNKTLPHINLVSHVCATPNTPQSVFML